MPKRRLSLSSSPIAPQGHSALFTPRVSPTEKAQRRGKEGGWMIPGCRWPLWVTLPQMTPTLVVLDRRLLQTFPLLYPNLLKTP